jgi:hypothetical protein
MGPPSGPYLVLQQFCNGVAMISGHMGGHTGADGGPYGVLDGSHVIGHIIFECHVIRLGWQGVILLSTLLNQCWVDPTQALLCHDRRVRYVTTRHKVTSPSFRHN